MEHIWSELFFWAFSRKKNKNQQEALIAKARDLCIHKVGSQNCNATVTLWPEFMLIEYFQSLTDQSIRRISYDIKLFQTVWAFEE